LDVLFAARKDQMSEQSLSVQSKIVRYSFMLSVLKEPITAWKLKRKQDHLERKSTKYSVSHIDLSKSSKRSMIKMPRK
jgi:hypothetical protein